jgi:hypothetical protein
MRFFAITLAGAGVRAAVVEVTEVLEEVVVAVAIAGPFPQKEPTRVRANLDLLLCRSPIEAPTPVSGSQ